MKQTQINHLRRNTLAFLLTKGVGFRTFLKEFNKTRDIHTFNWSKFKLNTVEVDRFIAKLATNNTHWFCFWEDEYPEVLRQMYDAPLILFAQGNYSKTLFTNAISIVGTRKVSAYGKRVTEDLARGLSSFGYTIVSGMALGVDKIAHESTMVAKGKTVAVLAGPVHIPSPQTNFSTYKKIIATGGCIVSDCLPGATVTPGMFAKRNRIVASLSKAIIVTEAGEKSGAKITATLGLELGKEVFAVPGSIYSPQSKGTNELLAAGEAHVARRYQDVLEILGHTQGTKVIQKTIEDLNTVEHLVYQALLTEQQGLDELAISTQLSLSKISGIVARLELRGMIMKNSQQKYSLITG